MKLLLVPFGLINLLLIGCAASRPTLQYDALPTPSVGTFYLDGNCIASCASDSSYFSLAIDRRAYVGGYGNLRAWFLFQNRATAPCLLRPWTILRLDIVDTLTGEKYPLAAASPNTLLTRIDEQEASENLFSFLGGALRAYEISSSNVSTRHKVRELASIVGSTSADLTATQAWYSIVRESMSSTLLRKNTVLPGASVNGYVYFPLQTEKGSFTTRLFSSKRWKCVFTVATPTGEQEVVFAPVDIE